MDRSKMSEYIKVNFPLTEEDFNRGNGEGMWVLVDAATKADYDKDATGKGYVGILDNDSLYYPGLKHGDVVPFEMRGESRPVADYHDFLSDLNGLTQEEKMALFLKISVAQEGRA